MEPQAVNVQRMVEIDLVDHDHVVTRIYGDSSYEGMALIVCDFVRHIALMKKVEEDEVWKWIDLERRHHTTDVIRTH
jgi:hypothetical protein